MSSNDRDALKRQVLALVARGLSLRDVADKVGVPRSTIHRWTKGVLPAPSSTPSSKVSAPDPEPDLGTVEGLSAEQTRLYSALDAGFDRAKVVQLSYVGKALAVLKESGCADHYGESDLRRICDGINATWLRQLEVVTRDMLQIVYADAKFLLDRTIEKVRVELMSVNVE